MKKYILLLLGFFVFLPATVIAAPYFYLDNLQTVYGNQHEVKLYLYSDQTITLAQTVFSFDNTYITPVSKVISYAGCFPSPADPALGYGTQNTPYFYNDQKFVLSCGFASGYISSESEGDLIATIKFDTEASGSAALTFESGATKMYYIGSSVTPGAMSNETLVIDPYVASAPSSGETPESATQTLTTSDLNYVEIGVNSTSTTTTTSSSNSDATLSVIEEDNTIPDPGNLPDRDRPAPLLSRLLSNDDTSEEENEGEVLSAQSLRELLIPGKSSADKTVVLINLVSVLTFVFILGILIWKFMNIKRMNKLRAQHMSELLMGELAVIETKIGSDSNNSSKESVKSNIGETIKKISEELKDTT